MSLDVDPETNPWGLALDGFTPEGPRRLPVARDPVDLLHGDAIEAVPLVAWRGGAAGVINY